ncbi:MAG: hypothetical protein ISN28_01050, partial [Ectothiorhodospiraceae bacterium AqS1]|nr:hypothetical protein [Ectothiorhodospiraceae bacterium AqS1]
MRFQNIPLTIDEGESVTSKIRLDNDRRSIFEEGEFQEVSISSSHPSLLSVDKSRVSVDKSTWVDIILTAHDDDVFLASEVELLFELNDNHLIDAVHRVRIVDDDASRLIVDKISVTVNEEGSSDFTVKLGNRPFGHVDLRMAKSGSPEMTLDTDFLKTGNQSTLRFTETNWNIARTVRVSAASDPDAADDSAAIAVSSRGEFPRDGYDDQTAQVSVTIVDDETASIVFDPRRTQVNEGSSASLNASLATEPTETVTLHFFSPTNPEVSVDTTPAAESIGTSLTFSPDNWNRPQTVEVSAADDDDTTNDHAFIPVRASGGDYESITLDHPVQITDDDTTDLIFSDFPDSISEDASAHTFGLRLIRQPTTDVTITLALVDSTDSARLGLGKTSFVFTRTNWNTLQNGTLTPVDNDEMSGDVDVELGFTPAGGGLDGSVIKRTVSVLDDDQAGVEFEGVPVTIEEGSSATIKARLATRPHLEQEVSVTFQPSSNGDLRIGSDNAPVVLEFTRADWNTWQTIDVSAAADDDELDESAIIPWAASGGEYGDAAKNIAAITGNVNVNISEDSATTPRSLLLEDVPVTLEEGTNKTFKIKLDTRPDRNVQVTLTQPDNGDIKADTDAATVGYQTTLNFTPADWNSAKTITVSAAHDYDADDDSGTIQFSVSGGGYDDVTAQAKVSVIDDDRTPALVLEDTPLTIDEGASGTFDVYLAARPSADVRLTFSRAPPTNSDIALDTDTATEGNQRTLSFTASNWYIARSVTISAAEDEDISNDSQTFNITASGGNYAGITGQVSVVVVDNDTPMLILDPTSITIDESHIDHGRIAVKLSVPPTSDVTVTLIQPTNKDVTADTDVSTPGNQTSLTFGTTDWNTAKTVRVTAGHDDDPGDDFASISFVASGGGYVDIKGSVSVTVTDDDHAILRIDPVKATLWEGDSLVRDVWLSQPPTGDVTIEFHSDNADVTVDSDSETAGNQNALEFTTDNYNTKQKITIYAADDEDRDKDHAKITVSGNGGGYDDVIINTVHNSHPDNNHYAVTVGDDDTEQLEYRNFPHHLNEGASATFQVRLKSRPIDDLSVKMNYQDGNRSSRIGMTDVLDLGDVTNLTFTPDDWDQWQSFSVKSQDNIYNYLLGANRYDFIYIDFSIETLNYKDSKEIHFIDDDEIKLLFDPNPIRVLEGGNLALKVKPSVPPAVNVGGSPGSKWEVTFSQSSNTDIIMDTDAERAGNQTGLVFYLSGSKPWNQWQSIILNAAEDDDFLNEKVVFGYKMKFVPSGALSSFTKSLLTLEAKIIDNDNDFSLVFDDTPLVVDEGKTGYFGIKLSNEPTADVTVNLEQPSNTDVTVDTDTVAAGNQTALTFTPENFDTSQRIAVSASRDDDADDDSATIAVSAAGGAYDGKSATVKVSVHDTHYTQRFVIDKDTVGLIEGGSAPFSVRLLISPAADLKVEVSESNNPDISLDKNELTFTPDNWNRSQVITVSAVHDADIIDDRAMFDLTAGDDGDASVTGRVRVEVTDDDKAHILINPPEPVILEEDSTTAKIKLGIPPTGNVTLTLTPEAGSDLTLDTDSDQTGDQNTLAFTITDWNVEQEIVLKAAQDDDNTNDNVKVNVSASGGNYEGVLVDLIKKSTYIPIKITDDDFILTFQGLPKRLGEGNTATLRYRLNPNYTDTNLYQIIDQIGSVNMYLKITDLDSLIATGVDIHSYFKVNDNSAYPGGSGYLLDKMTRANYDEWQEIKIEAVDNDRFWFRSKPFSVELKFPNTLPGGGSFGEQILTIIDDESADLIFQPPTATVVEGESLAVNVKMSVPPARVLRTPQSGDLSRYIHYDWTVTLGAPDDSDLSLDKKTLTFTSSGDTKWDTWQTINLSAAEDADGIDDKVTLSAKATARHDIRAVGLADYVLNDELQVTIDDKDGAILDILDLEDVPVSVDEGASKVFKVKLKSAPTASRTLTFQQPANGDVTVDTDTDTTGNQVALTFTSADWDTAKEVTVSAGEDDDAIDETASIPLTLTGESGEDDITSAIPVAVDDNDTPGVAFEDFPDSVDEGASATFKVRLASIPSSDVNVSIASGDTSELTLDKKSLDFTTANWKTWQNVTLTAVEDDEAYGPPSIDIVFTPDAGYGQAATKTVEVSQDDSVGVLISQTPLSIPEGGTQSFKVRLASRPAVYGRTGSSNTVSIVFSKKGGSDSRFNIGSGNIVLDDTATLTIEEGATGQFSVDLSVMPDA